MAVELRAAPATKPGAIARLAEQFGMHPETSQGAAHLRSRFVPAFGTPRPPTAHVKARRKIETSS